MAFIFSGDEKYRVNDDDYRAYLITPRSFFAVQHSMINKFMRFRVHVRTAKKLAGYFFVSIFQRETHHSISLMKYVRSQWKNSLSKVSAIRIGEAKYDPERYYMRGPGPKYREKQERKKREDGIRIPHSLDSKWDF